MVKLYSPKSYFLEIRFFLVSKIAIFDVHSARSLISRQIPAGDSEIVILETKEIEFLKNMI